MAIHNITFLIAYAVHMHPYINSLPIVHRVGMIIMATDNNVKAIQNK